jgi:hypothetical protein
MRKFLKILMGICVILLLVIVGAVTYTLNRMCKQNPELAEQEREGPTILIDSISSYLTVDEAIIILEKEGYSSVNITEQKLSPTDRRPRFDFVRIEISDYQSLNQKGELKITFFNDRLEGVHYCADNIALYLRSRSEAVNPLEHYIETIETSSCVWISDKRIAGERKRWLRCYS